MRAFWELCYFEQKKLLKKTSVRIALAFIVLVTILLNIYPFFQTNQVAYLDDDGEVVIKEVNYLEEVQLERKFAKEFNGICLTNEVTSSVRELNQKYQEKTKLDDGAILPLMNMRLPYRSLMRLGINPGAPLEDLADFAYEHMLDAIEAQAEDVQNISAEERQHWAKQKENIEVPFTMYYGEGYYNILRKVEWINILGLLFIVLCLCGSFADEYTYRTDAIVRASRFGTTKISVAKLVAGELMVVMTVLLLFGITALIQLGVHGMGGIKAVIQLWNSPNGVLSDTPCYELSVGMAVLITFTVSLLLGTMMGAVTMLLSKLFRQSVPAIVVPFGVFLVPFIFSTTQNNAAKRIFSYFPFQRLEVSEFLTDMRMVKVFGNLLDARQMSILLYGGLTILALGMCMMICKVTTKERK